ncbi:MAG: glycerol kinase GlpK [Planctomycetota bacterium]
MTFILALDQGTTSSRSILFDQAGQPLGVAQQEFTQHFPQPGWVEHDAEEIWQTQLETARQVLRDTGTDLSEIAAIGIANQRETVVLWDRKTGEPIHHAIVWQDRRTAAFCQQLMEVGQAETIRSKTGLVIDAYFSASKLRWLLDHVDGAREAAERGELAFGTVDSWLIYRLTGGRCHVTDPSNASRTMLYNLHEHEWDTELLELFDIPAGVLPEVVGSSEVVGESDADVLGAAIPIAGLAGDQQAALFGNQCVSPGELKTTYGTGCFMLMNTGEAPVDSANRLLTTVAWRIKGQTTYALEGSVFIGGAVVQWLRDGLGLIVNASEIEALAASVPDCGGVTLVPAFAGLGAPYWDADARGLIAGITRGTTKAHFARAALEGIAFQVADVMGVMEKDAGRKIEAMRVDGGASANNLLMQMQANLSQCGVIRPRVTETTALGAAYLAGLAVGFWESQEQIAAQWSAERTFESQIEVTEAETQRRQWSRAVERAAGWDRATS